MQVLDIALSVLKELEERALIDSNDGTPKEKRVRCVTRAVGELLHTLVLIRQPNRILELGTSAGYSTIWLASAARNSGGSVITVDRDAAKIAWAENNLKKAELREIVELRCDDTNAVINADEGFFDFVFMDHSSALYLDSFEAVRSKISPKGIILADGWGTIERWQTEPTLKSYFDRVNSDPDYSTFLMPIEKGALLSVRL